MANYPEQSLLACIVQGWFPKSIYFIILYIITDKGSRCTVSLGKSDAKGGHRTCELTNLLVE